MSITRDAVLEAVLAWAKADREADDRAAAAGDGAAATDALSRACKIADDAEEKMRDLANAYLDQATTPDRAKSV